MKYTVFVFQGDKWEWDWSYSTLKEAEAEVARALGAGYEDARVEPESEAEALDQLLAEVAELRGRLRNRNRQIRDLRRSLRK